jgi:rhodanese-related sulfurtransferase
MSSADAARRFAGAARHALTQVNEATRRDAVRSVAWDTAPACRRPFDPSPPEPETVMQPHLQEMTPTEVHEALRARRIVLIDVREPQEYVNERIHGALLFPLSTFDPGALPVGERPAVLHCGSGKRSAMAVAKCIEAGVPVATHLKGGLLAWKHARFPTITLDPGSGAVVGRK